MINQSIFKSYDVRGIYPTELNEEAAFLIGRAFVKYTGAKKVAVGYDARLSSPALFKTLTQGLLAEGVEVMSIGQVPTECLYFAVASYDFDAGIMITASHNPKEYNGFKMIRKNGNDLNIVRGLDLLALVEKDTRAPFEGARPSTQIKDLSALVLEDYIGYIFSPFDLTAIKKFKVVVDVSNGVMGNVLSKAPLPVGVIPLNFEPDGNFPNHAPNPLEPGASDQIKETIKKNGADFGFIFDGDADRIFLVNEMGEMVQADIVLILLAKYFLSRQSRGSSMAEPSGQKNQKMGIAYNAICSKAVPEFVKKWGGVPVRTQVGAVNVRDGLLKNNGVMGGEVSAHYCFRDYFYMDSGMMAFLAMLQIIFEDGRKVSEIIKEISPYFKTDANFQVADKEGMLNKIRDNFTDGKQDFLDGVTVEYKDWWFNVRPSNTEPLLRLTIEANTQELLDQKKIELTNFITK
jgi:phosphomannomutase